MDGSGHGVPGGQGVDDVSGGQDVAGRGIPDPGSTGAEAGETDRPFQLRQNRSQAVPLSKEPSQIELFKRGVRAKSIQESEVELASRMKDMPTTRSVSFNSVSVVIDSLMSSYGALAKRNNPDMVEAISQDNLVALRGLVAIGSIEMKDVLFKVVEVDKPSLLTDLLRGMEDVNIRLEDGGQALLHRAAEKGCLECCRVLVELGADVNLWDTRRQETPLHSAVLPGPQSVEIIEFLVNNSADIDAGLNRDGGSVLHAAVRRNNVEAVRFLLENQVKTVPKTFSETALHTAADNNRAEIADLLLQHNRMLVDALKGEKRRLTSLHLAAEHGYSEVAAVLLDHGANLTLTTADRSTALHFAARSRTEPVLRGILEKSRSVDVDLVNKRDADGRTPLLICTSSKGQGAVDCMETLLSMGAEVDAQDTSGFTALHLAAIDRKASRVNLLIEHCADLSVKNKAGLSALYFINKKVPQCMKSLEYRLDTGMKLDGGASELSSKVKLDFTKLSSSINSYEKQDITFFMELMASPHQHILKHPLSEAFLYLKWNQVKYLYIVFIVSTHFIFSVVFTLYALLVYSSLCQPVDDVPKEPGQRWNIFHSYINCTASMRDASKATEVNEVAITAWIFLIIFLVIYVLKEALKFISSPARYFQQLESYHDLLIIATTLSIVWLNPLLQTGELYVGRWQYHAASIGCFSTWLYMMFLIGRVPRFGKYVQMFRTVSMSVLNFMIAYIFLIFAFASAFMVLFPQHDAFAILPAAIIKLIVMMLGEIDYEDMYYSQSEHIINSTIETTTETQHFPVTAHFFLFLFTVLVSIILMNLLVGLAVSDIQGLSKSARLHQLIQQVNLINYMERLLFSPYFKYFPDSVQAFLRSKLQGLQGSNKTVYTIKPHDINDKTLPESLKRTIFDNCIRRDNRDTKNSQKRQLENMNRFIHRILKHLEVDTVDRGGGGVAGSVAGPTIKTRRSSSSTQLNSLDVEDDLDSDYEERSGGGPRSGRLGSIQEERLRRVNSYISSESTGSEGATLSDYLGIDDKEDYIP